MLKIVAAILSLFCFTYPFVVYPALTDSGPSWLGLDVSWQMTLNYALQHHWNWGKDIIYNYGPLGFLSTRMGLGISKWVFILFDVFLIYNFYCIFKTHLLQSVDKFIALLMVVGMVLLMSTNHGSDLAWVLTVFIYFWMFRSYQQPNAYHFSMIIINLLLCFFVKMNTGLVSMVFLLAHMGNLLVFRIISIKKAIVIFVSLTALLLIAALLLNVSIVEYITGASEIIKGYSDVMFIDEDNFIRYEVNITTMFFAAILLYFIYIVLAFEQKKYPLILFACFAAAYFFLMRKQAVFRNDIQHYSEFFTYAPLVFLAGFFGGFEERYQVFLQRFALVIMVFVMFFAMELPYKRIDTSFNERFLNSENYFKQIENYNTTHHIKSAHLRYIPKEVLNEIGDKTVDIFPWDSEYLIENKLNYRPRPVFQSFTVFTPKLQQINYQYYLKNAPEYIIYDYDAIDGRYPFNDDFLINYFICKNYTFATSFISNSRYRILLKKKPQIYPIEEVPATEVESEINREIPVNWVMSMRIELAYNLAGKLKAFFERPPKLIIKMTDRNGQVRQYKASVQILKSGIMLDRWVNDTRGFETYMRHKDSLDVFKSVMIVADSDYYNKKIKVKYINIK